MARNGPVALVTGGARRVGAAIIQDLSAHGFGVAIHCNRSREEADRLADEIGRAGGRAVVLPADLSDIDAASGLVAAAADALGPVRLLVNNASAFDDDSPADPDWEKWDRHFALHLKTPVALASTMARTLAADSDGLVVNLIDQRVWKLTPQFFSYTLSKSALWTATRTMAQGLAPRVRVNAIGPGPTLKNARQAVSDFRAQTDALPLGHGPLLTEFGATIRYLWQTPSITGQMIALDGGQHLAWQTPDVTGMRE
ncbi:MAG: SDR family oxidoreductase [Nitratireductor sp.]